MPRYRRLLQSATVLLVILLGLVAAAPAGVAAQDEDANRDGDTLQGDAPDCDDNGWRILTTEDGDGFASEARCDAHVDRYGDDSLVEVGADEEDAYVAVTITEAIGPKCKTTVTLVGGQNDQVAEARITAASGAFFQPTFIPANGETSHSALIDQGDSLVSGTAEFLDSDWNPTGETIPVYLPSATCT